jgi:hypothetical protein
MLPIAARILSFFLLSSSLFNFLLLILPSSGREISFLLCSSPWAHVSPVFFDHDLPALDTYLELN